MKNPQRPPSLRQQVSSGLAWSLLQTWGSRLITLGVFLVLARLLGPADFGVVTSAYVFIGLLVNFVDLGVADALVRREDRDASHCDTVFWVTFGFSLLLYAALAAAAPLLGALFGQPTLAPLLWILGGTLPLAALAIVHDAVMRSQMRFKPLAMRALVASLVGGAVGIALAALGFGYWALVAKGFAESIVGLAMLWSASGWRPGRALSGARWRELFGVGRHLLFSRALDATNQRLDAMIIGARLGPAPLGLYSAGQRIYGTMMESLFTAVNRIALPAFSKLQSDLDALGRALLRLVAMSSFVTMPLFALTAVLADPVVGLLFGERWLAAAPVLAAFCAGGIVFSVSFYNIQVLTATGRTDRVAKIIATGTALNTLGVLVGVHWGAVGVAVAITLRGYLVMPLGLVLLRRTIGLSLAAWGRAIAPALVASLASGALLAGAMALWPAAGPVDAPRAVALIAAAPLVHLAIVLGVFPHASREVLTELQRTFPKLPLVGLLLKACRGGAARP